MAIAYYDVACVARGRGRRRTAAAALDYAQREGIYTGDRADVLAQGRSGPDLGDWSVVDHAEDRSTPRATAQVARTIIIALPHELTHEARAAAVQAHADALRERHGVAVEWAVHRPSRHRKADSRNYHAHLVLTTRQVSDDGKIGAKTRELGEKLNSSMHIAVWRRGWQRVANRALAAAGSSARLDMRSYARQGIEQEPTRHLGPAATAQVRAGTEKVPWQEKHNRGVGRRNAVKRTRQELAAATQDYARERRKRGRERAAAQRERTVDRFVARRAMGPVGPRAGQAPERLPRPNRDQRPRDDAGDGRRPPADQEAVAVAEALGQPGNDHDALVAVVGTDSSPDRGGEADRGGRRDPAPGGAHRDDLGAAPAVATAPAPAKPGWWSRRRQPARPSATQEMEERHARTLALADELAARAQARAAARSAPPAAPEPLVVPVAMPEAPEQETVEERVLARLAAAQEASAAAVQDDDDEEIRQGGP